MKPPSKSTKKQCFGCFSFLLKPLLRLFRRKHKVTKEVVKGEDVHTRHEECEKEEVIRVGVEDLHREDASRPEDTFLSDIQVGGQVTVCVPVERENPETVTKTWAEEVEEVYPVSDDNLNHFPDSFVGKCTDEMQCSGNEGKKQASPTPPPEEACVCVCEETQPKVTISVNTSNISDDHVVTESVYIEPKYHFQAIGINQCVLSALEKIYNVKAIFNDANNKIIIHGVSKNVKPCKEDVEFNMSVRRWWDQEPNKAAPLPNTYYKYNDIRQGSSHANLNTVETFTTCHTDVVIETVYIEPKYHFQAIGIDNCVLKALETIYKVKIVFNEFNNKICIQGSQKQVKLCKEDIEFNMSVRRWWDEEHTDTPPNTSTQHQKENTCDDAASQDYHDAASQDYYQCYEITNDDAASQDYYQCYENTCDDTASQHYYRCYESTNDDAASQNYYQYYESSSQYEAARSYYQYYESTDHYAASRQYYCDYDSTKQNEGARDYYCYYDCTNDYADARDYYR